MAMLLPRFSMRWLLAATAIGAVFFLIVSLAFNGHQWAGAVVAALVTAMLALLVQASFFFVVWVYSEITKAIAGPGQEGPDHVAH